MARVLRGLRIEEVSSVDKAANPGARVVLLKRDNGQPAHPALDLAGQIQGVYPDMSTTRALAHAAALIRSTKVTKTNNGNMRVIKLDDGTEFKIPDDGSWDAALKNAGLEEMTPVDKSIDVVAIAKALIAGELGSTTLTKADFHAAMRTEAAKRHPALSPQQAVAKYISEEGGGRALHQAMKIAPDFDVRATPQPRRQEDTPSHRALVALAREMSAASPDVMTPQQAMTAVLRSPRGNELYQAARNDMLTWSTVVDGRARVSALTNTDDLPLAVTSDTPPGAPPNSQRQPDTNPDGNATTYNIDGAPGQDAAAELRSKADALAKADKISFSKAYSKVITDPENRELFRQAKREGITGSAHVAAA